MVVESRIGQQNTFVVDFRRGCRINFLFSPVCRLTGAGMKQVSGCGHMKYTENGP
jgi:hypothetical protein